ncbi:MAG TPA: chemotaxis protein CheB [Myxococcales bacterium]|nr:chemotaxis protein CheB [Myxococcales bacterium]
MGHRDIVVIGASAGGIEALSAIARRLPADLGAAVFVVLHLAPEHKSVLPRILSSAGPLPAKHARNGEAILPNRIYVAAPDHHLLIHENHVRVVRGPRENGHRPAIDPLFRTAAYSFGPRVIAVVLSGALDDGTAGLASVKTQGGLAVVQDPNDAVVDAMPRSALENVEIDHVASAADMGSLIANLVREGVPTGTPERGGLLELESALLLNGSTNGILKVGEPSGLGCPDCGGVLNEVPDGDLLRFRCRVGHAYAPESLYLEESTALEGALWAALRALEEQAALSHRMASRARELGQTKSAVRYEERAESAEAQATTVRDALRLGAAPKSDVGG